jgi:hypothetical protein
MNLGPGQAVLYVLPPPEQGEAMSRHERSHRGKDDDAEFQKALETEFFLEGLDPIQREWASLREPNGDHPPRRRRKETGRQR